jgi:hypothetical protein
MLLGMVSSLLTHPSRTQAASGDLFGLPGSGAFGSSVTLLPNGNIVVTDPRFDAGAVIDVGAVYLYNGATRALISTLTGSSANDQVGSAGITVLTNGNYVVRSPFWDNGSTTDAGAVTWGSSTSGVSGAVSSSNSLVGSTASDQVGGLGIVNLSNGNYVVRSPGWDNGGATDAGAVTWGSGTTGVSGAVSSSNSLVGSTANDQVGGLGIVNLSNGNYVVRSPGWDNGGATDAGAVTWGSGTTGVSGVVSSSNSLVGSTANNLVGGLGIVNLSNDNYVVISPEWDNGGATDAGAVTWGSGTTGVSGVVSSSNSLVGSTANNLVGGLGIVNLSNGNYVVISPEWDNGSATDAGAVTWGNGLGGTVGVVSSSNSLVGSTANVQVGDGRVTALTNGNYVVRSSNWDNGSATDAGAVTWGNGTTGITGAVSSSNSLVGNTTDDRVGSSEVTALTNGNYVVRSPSWDNGSVVNAGAVTWGNGLGGTVGAVSSSNSLVGSTTNDQISSSGVTALTNGNYVVRSAGWDNGSAANAGAVTWGNGLGGTVGAVSSSNSLVGSTADDQVGGGISTLTNGNYVVRSAGWDNGSATNAGAVTWGNGLGGTVGAVSSSNSLVGSTANDLVGNIEVLPLINGNYVVRSSGWNNGSAVAAGAVTWGNGLGGTVGVVSSSNSLVGSTANDQVGNIEVLPLINGNYVVRSSLWDNGSATDAGAVTWGNGLGGTVGAVSSSNSLVGSTANDQLGNTGIFQFTGDHYVVRSVNWDNGSTINVGALSIGNSARGSVGFVTANLALVGTRAQSGNTFTAPAYNPTLGLLALGIPQENRVALVQEPTFISAALPTGQVNSAYSHTFSASGIPAPTFALHSGSVLPPGLSLSSTGVLNGVATVGGSFTFTVVASNGMPPDATQSVTLVINASPTITSTAPPAGQINSAYSHTFTATGSPTPTFSLQSGSLPPGLSLLSTGVLSGIPTTIGSFTFTVIASNGTLPNATQNVSVVINASPTITSAAPPAGQVNSAYSHSFTATGVPTPTFSLQSGSTLPPGLSLSSTGVLSGTPTVNGSFSFTVVASNGFLPNATQQVTLVIGKPPTITSAAPPAGQVNSAYSHSFTATGVPTPTFSLQSGSTLPPGLSLSSTGVLSGTPTVNGSFSFTVVASNGFLPNATQQVTLVIGKPPTITSAAPPAGQVNSAYSHSFTATGVPTPTFSLQSGSTLPPGLSLSSTGVLSGTPTANGSFSFTVVASNGFLPNATQQVTLVIGKPPTITSTAPPTGQVNSAYSHTFSATGVPTPTFSLQSGSTLPPGLSLSSTGVLSGTPTATGTFSFTVVASNGSTPNVTQQVTLIIRLRNVLVPLASR